jgi:hypothetical protein
MLNRSPSVMVSSRLHQYRPNPFSYPVVVEGRGRSPHTISLIPKIQEPLPARARLAPSNPSAILAPELTCHLKPVAIDHLHRAVAHYKTNPTPSRGDTLIPNRAPMGSFYKGLRTCLYLRLPRQNGFVWYFLFAERRFAPATISYARTTPYFQELLHREHGFPLHHVPNFDIL